MRIISRTVYYPKRSDAYTLYPLTDLHIGSRYVDTDALTSVVAAIAADPHAVWLGLGDYIDAITRKGDRRHFESQYAPDLWGKDDVIQHQIDLFLTYLAPIADKCLGLLCGNHEKAVLRHYDNNAYEKIVREIATLGGHDANDLRLGTSGFLSLVFKRGHATAKTHPTTTYTLYCHHGYGGGRLKGGKALNLERALIHFQADIVLMGHVHDFLLTTKTLVCPDGSLRHCFGAFLPSFVQMHQPGGESYAEDAGYFPGIVGSMPIEFLPNTRSFIFHIMR